MFWPFAIGAGVFAGYLALRPPRTFDPELIHDGAACDPRALAAEVALEVMDGTPRTYSRHLLSTFQRQVGVPVTTRYDGETHGALIAMGIPEDVIPPPDVGASVPYFGSLEAT